jgi:hypothetical protein
LFINGKFESYTLEDEYRAEKVRGETRIPAGTYKIKFREVLSGMTKKYREKYDFFTWHLEIQDVPNFQYVYLHAGNRDDETDGCVLIGDGANNNQIEDGRILSSRQAFTRVYKKITEALEISENVTLEIINRDRNNDIQSRHGTHAKDTI